MYALTRAHPSCFVVVVRKSMSRASVLSSGAPDSHIHAHTRTDAYVEETWKRYSINIIMFPTYLSRVLSALHLARTCARARQPSLHTGIQQERTPTVDSMSALCFPDPPASGTEQPFGNVMGEGGTKLPGHLPEEPAQQRSTSPEGVYRVGIRASTGISGTRLSLAPFLSLSVCVCVYVDRCWWDVSSRRDLLATE